MDGAPGSVGTAANLSLRLGQPFFSIASLLFMSVGVDFYSYTGKGCPICTSCVQLWSALMSQELWKYLGWKSLLDKITSRLKKLSYGLSAEHRDPVLGAQKVCACVYKGVTTSQLDELAAETAATAAGHRTWLLFPRTESGQHSLRLEDNGFASLLGPSSMAPSDTGKR